MSFIRVLINAIQYIEGRTARRTILAVDIGNFTDYRGFRSWVDFVRVGAWTRVTLEILIVGWGSQEEDRTRVVTHLCTTTGPVHPGSGGDHWHSEFPIAGVFEFECGYWNAQAECRLRARMCAGSRDPDPSIVEDRQSL